ncbi:hypothetical protein BS101_08810 [Clostridium kluyveri]|uniref:Uncharacterized protein n=1 Tax=Clostridium kluyveri TaxID=1534 RepID=A0A1L5F744_CLOKL|nr:hypothetical protein BS101_08810 [Clostridium kluyveri]
MVWFSQCGLFQFIEILKAIFLGYIKKHDFKVFGWYRIALGILVILITIVYFIQFIEDTLHFSDIIYTFLELKEVFYSILMIPYFVIS